MLHIMDDDVDSARALINDIPDKYYDFLAKFLD